MRRAALFYIFAILGSVWLTRRYWYLEPYLLLPSICYKSHIRKPWENFVVLFSENESEKGKSHFIIIWKSFDLMDPLKGSQGPSRVLRLNYTLRTTPCFLLLFLLWLLMMMMMEKTRIDMDFPKLELCVKFSMQLVLGRHSFKSACLWKSGTRFGSKCCEPTDIWNKWTVVVFGFFRHVEL